MCPARPSSQRTKKTTKLGKQKNPGKTGRNNKKETLPDRISLSADEMDRCRSRLRFVCAFFFVVFNPFRVFLRFFSLSLSVVVFFSSRAVGVIRGRTIIAEGCGSRRCNTNANTNSNNNNNNNSNSNSNNNSNEGRRRVGRRPRPSDPAL